MAAPRQRNSDDENRDLKAGWIPKAWQKQPAKLRQKDRDARWIVKFAKAKLGVDGKVQREIAVPIFGYQNHISIDRRYRLIRRWEATDAAAYEGRMLRRGLLDKTNTGSTVWADTAFRSKANEQCMAEHGFVSHVHRKKPHGRPMPAHSRRANGRKSKVRAQCLPRSGRSFRAGATLIAVLSVIEACLIMAPASPADVRHFQARLGHHACSHFSRASCLGQPPAWTKLPLMTMPGVEAMPNFAISAQSVILSTSMSMSMSMPSRAAAFFSVASIALQRLQPGPSTLTSFIRELHEDLSDKAC